MKRLPFSAFRPLVLATIGLTILLSVLIYLYQPQSDLGRTYSGFFGLITFHAGSWQEQVYNLFYPLVFLLAIYADPDPKGKPSRVLFIIFKAVIVGTGLAAGYEAIIGWEQGHIAVLIVQLIVSVCFLFVGLSSLIFMFPGHGEQPPDRDESLSSRSR